MLTTVEPLVVATRHSCAVCESSKLETIVDLPNLPLTGRFSKEPAKSFHKGFDQRLLFCPQCAHLQLAFQINPEELYSNQYYFRTSASDNARRGTAFFLNALNEFFPQRQFQCALDVGCNDLFLLKQLKSKVRQRVGIDPIWKSQGADCDPESSGIEVIGECIESLNLKDFLKSSPDLIILRHTLEHIYQPKAVLEKLFNEASDGAVVAVEVPSSDALLTRLRFDQIFHEHLQYFSLSSLQSLIREIGGTFLGYRENYHDWGAVCVLFTKQKRSDWNPCPAKDTAKEIKERYTFFRRQMSMTAEVLEKFKGTKVYGYGASNMLPALAYHLGNDLACLECGLDDDPAKENLYYWNLPLQIKRPEFVGKFNEATILLTAIDQAQPILKRLLENRPKHIIYPTQII